MRESSDLADESTLAAEGPSSVDETEVARVGDGLFSLWSVTSLAAASMAGGMSSRIGSPLQRDSDQTSLLAANLAARLRLVDAGNLRRSAELTRRLLRFELEKLAQAEALHRFDLQITPYRIGHAFSEVYEYVKAFDFEAAIDLERYLDLLRQCQAFVAGILQNLHDQLAHRIAVPAEALPSCLAAIKGLAESFSSNLQVAPSRMARLDPSQRQRFLLEVEQSFERLRAAFAELSTFVEGDYARHTVSQAGLSHYHGGGDAYELLIRHHTTLRLTAEDVHKRGHELVGEIEADMARLRSQIGFSGSGREFLERIRGDRRFYCNTAEEVGELYLRLMRRGEAVMPKAFGSLSFAPCGVRRLPPESEGGMTFGYYQPPVIGGEQAGYYVYNGSLLDQRPTIGAASLIYHELIPGHHLHFSTEMADTARPMVRRYPNITAFTEGWAEYAADLGFELGLYEDPYDRYGRYLLQVFLASRLVVDTGLNAFGWTLQQARAYLLEHTAQSATEINSEVLRYSCGMPGQALAYAPGRKHFWQVRHAAEQQLGPRFDLPAFHAAILGGGSLPLDDLSFSIQQWATAVSGTPSVPARSL